ncbi:SDR family NAD(P)-dependent oxidoreductase [Streptomyces sp. NPDC088551]|uniref:SDR family NAD(P)-dependent oxidoreductase n=1 Tax=Streptomyces sp. NPDC088551 TaxID=3365863 RepID=UPI0037F88803
MRFSGKVAVVTGAASGIGRATAVRLAREGHHVALLDLDAAGLATTCARIEEAGGQAHPFTVDLCDPLEVGAVTREIAVTAGPPQVLVNVAGIGVAATVLETSDEDWNRVLTVNLTGPFFTTRATLPLMLDRRSGVIVNIASVAGQVGMARRAAYCASKAWAGRAHPRDRRGPRPGGNSLRGDLPRHRGDRVGREDPGERPGPGRRA